MRGRVTKNNTKRRNGNIKIKMQGSRGEIRNSCMGKILLV